MTLTTSDGDARARGWTDTAELPNDGRSGTLMDAIWPEKIPSALRATVLIVAGSVLLALSAKAQVPFQIVPGTMQTLAVMVIAAAYGPWLGAGTVLAYLIEGALGLPVFASGAGAAYLIANTGGFLMGMLPAAFIVGWDAKLFGRSIPRLLAAMLIADAIVFAIGFAWLAYVANGVGIGTANAWTYGVSPFLFGDALKIGIAACLVPAAWALLKRRH